MANGAQISNKKNTQNVLSTDLVLSTYQAGIADAGKLITYHSEWVSELVV